MFKARLSVGTLALLVSLSSIPAIAQPDPHEPRGNAFGRNQDDLKHPLGARQRSARQEALKDKLNQKASGRIHRIANGQYVELSLERTDRVFVILAEFGNAIHPAYGGTPGPLRNQIPQPNRALDNNTIWQADYNRAHYQNMYFTQMVDYYRSQSSGRYTINGAVAEWVRVPFNEARYGANYCGSNVCPTTWLLIRDAINIWTQDRLNEGMTLAQVKAYLDTFDRWDRYDYDNDGNFDEPDGYIDHFQIVHAGEDEATGGGAQGPDAIWSHRWYAFFNLIGSQGPAFNKLGGLQFGNAGLWVGDYTIQPENGGLGVFAHEYAHDLGLPDQYDTAGGDNSTGFWTIMSSGSYLGDGAVDIGSRPGDFTAWEKLQLGWLNYDIASGKNSAHRLGPAETNTKAAQGLFVLLPDRIRTLILGTPPQGTRAWYSGKGNNLDNRMTRTVTVPGGSPALTMQLWWDIETDWDYAYVEVSTNGGATFVPLAGNVTTNTNPNGQNFGNGITGSSNNNWVAASFNMSAYAGQTVLLRLRYWTDGAVEGKGILADAITLGSFTDGAEAGANGWTLAGWKASTGVEASSHFNAYVAEYRQYRGYDTGLRTGPYNFGFLNTRPNFVEHYPYQDGLLVSYWDNSMTDNNTSEHPGEGLILPVDSHPVPLIRPDATPWRARVQTYDSPFGLEPTDAITLHSNGAPSFLPSLPPAPEFNDLLGYWSPATPLAGVIVPKTGTRIRVVNTSAQGNFMEVLVSQAK